MSDNIELPESAFTTRKEKIIPVAGPETSCIRNPFFGKELLTRAEALDCINLLSSMLIVDGRFTGSQKQY